MKGQRRRTRRNVSKNRRSKGHTRTAPVAPRTAEEFFAKPKRFQDRWIRTTHVVSKMRSDHVSLRKASREYGLAPQTVTRWAGSALRKRPNGRYAAKAMDELLRVLVIPQPGSKLRETAFRDSRQASESLRYLNAVQKYFDTGDASGIQEFVGKYVVDINGEQILLLTDLAELAPFGGAGFSYESFYARSA
jgi:hypothetical protein